MVTMHADNQHYDAQCFLSVGDLCLGILERVAVEGANTSNALTVLTRMAALTKIGQKYGKTNLLDVRSKWDGTGVWAAATEDMSLSDALRRCLHIGREESPGSPMLRQCPHRFAVIDASGIVTDIVAQSDIAMYLRRNIDLLDPSIVDATVKALGLGSQGSRRVVTVEASTPTIDCFQLMQSSNVQAVAVVDDGTDAIVGNLSETDLMPLQCDAYGALALPVGEFLVHAHLIVPKLDNDRMLYSPQTTAFGAALMCAGKRLTVTVTPDATVREILDLMHTRAVHRVWVVDDARRPTGVIALSDVLAAIAVEVAGAGETDTAKSMARSTGTTTTTAATSSPA